ncbi:MAG: hypothetical protein HFJ22_07370 [Clostridia bacterium]|nr:hypothetical protein [Clostridia bacterium]
MDNNACYKADGKGFENVFQASAVNRRHSRFGNALYHTRAEPSDAGNRGENAGNRGNTDAQSIYFVYRLALYYGLHKYFHARADKRSGAIFLYIVIIAYRSLLVNRSVWVYFYFIPLFQI